MQEIDDWRLTAFNIRKKKVENTVYTAVLLSNFGIPFFTVEEESLNSCGYLVFITFLIFHLKKGAVLLIYFSKTSDGI
jgi:hypothetical protein